MEIKTIFSLLVILLSCHIKPCGSECPVLYQGIKSHSACVSRSSDFISGSVSESDQKIILQEHNKFRAMTPACYMIKLYWNKEAAYVAQKWAENCEFEHDKKRSIPGYFSCGQNLGLGYTSWKSVITAWYDEIKDFTLDGKNVVSKVGHYTQVVWATSALIGCGFAKCQKGMRLYVCNYCPSGNNGGVNHPYDKCSNKTALQDCKGKVCHNTGAMEKTACKCKCPRYGHIYGPECNINCSVKDTGFCNNQFKENSCRFSNVPAQCPWMCKTCPYLEQYRNQGFAISSSTLMIMFLMAFVSQLFV